MKRSSKMPSDAAKEWSGTLSELTEKRDKLKRMIRQYTEEHRQQDEMESGDVDRKESLKQSIDTLNKAFDRIDEFLKTAELVLFHCDRAVFRGNPMIQVKAQTAGNGNPLPRGATQDWIIGLSPKGRAEKPSLAALRFSTRSGPLPSNRALRSTASRLAENSPIAAKEYKMGKGKRPREVKSNITDNESCKVKTSKGTIQGYNGIAAVDKKHQIIIDAQAYGEGQEHHTLAPVIDAIADKYKRLGIEENLFKTGAVFTADTGFANEANMKYLYENGINGYVPDNQFRSRDPRFQDQKKKHPRTDRAKPKQHKTYPSSDFYFDPVSVTCRCPADNELSFRNIRYDQEGNQKAFFEGKLLQCRNCQLKNNCMENPSAADHRKGKGRQVSFILQAKKKLKYTQWMQERIDSDLGKIIYAHRMSAVEPVFANMGVNKKLNRFSLRGKVKVQTQWRLYCLVHNVEKINHYGQGYN